MTSPDLRGNIFLDPTLYADQPKWHAVAADLRDNDPVLRVEEEGYTPFWAVTRHEDVFAVSRDNEHFLNTRNSIMAPDLQMEYLKSIGIEGETLIHMDGEEHSGHRGLANDWFRPRAVAKRQDAIDSIADEFVEKFRQMDGTCDFAQDIAVPYTLRVIMGIFGVPVEDEPTMLKLTQGIFGAADPEYLGDLSDPMALLTDTIAQFDQYFTDLTEERRVHPTDDLATVIANGEVNGCPLGSNARLWYYTIVATAGHDVVRVVGRTRSAAAPTRAGGPAAEPARAGQQRRRRNDPVDVPGPPLSALPDPARHPVQSGDPRGRPAAPLLPVGQPGRSDVRCAHGVRRGALECQPHDRLRRRRALLPGLAIRPSRAADGEPEWAQANFVGGVKHLPVTATFR